MPGAKDVVGYQVLGEEVIGAGGFLRLRRLRLKVVFADGSRSPEGIYDVVERPFGLDAVVLVLWRRTPEGRVLVLVRDGLRVPIYFGRPAPGERKLLFTEVVAGIIERGEDGVEAIRTRAALEALEEAGISVAAADIDLLGAAVYPTPGMCAEKFYLAGCRVSESSPSRPALGDGSPFEQGARLRWLDLDQALQACLTGEIEDMKTELILRRLRDHLALRPPEK